MGNTVESKSVSTQNVAFYPDRLEMDSAVPFLPVGNPEHCFRGDLYDANTDYLIRTPLGNLIPVTADDTGWFSFCIDGSEITEPGWVEIAVLDLNMNLVYSRYFPAE